MQRHTSQAMDIEQPDSEIVRFFNGKNVLITGGTGFLGKVLIHKLLFTCPDLGTIYIIIRPKKGKTTEERLAQDLLNVVIFDKLKEDPKLAKKIRAMEGDIMKPDLGLSKDDRSELVNTVNIIFHSAATVKFNDQVEAALQMNVQGTEELVELAKEMPNLASFVHVSTAFSHCYRSDIEEKFYPFRLDSADPNKISPWPNSYTMSKALAENKLSQFNHELPIAIVRPSIVVSSRSEPMPGWVDNMNGPNGMIVGFSTGFLRTVYLDKHSVSDIIPVDVVINLMCAVAYYRSLEPTKEQIPIFHSTSGSVNPLTWGEMKDLGVQSVLEYPFEKNTMFWYPGATYYSYKFLDSFHRLFSNWIPSLGIDTYSKLIGKKPKLLRTTSRMVSGMSVLEFFSTRQWNWSNRNTEELYQNLNATDQKLFNFDISQMDWTEFLRTSSVGCRRYLMKQSDDTLPESREHLNYLYKKDKVFKFILTSLLCIISIYFMISLIFY